MPSIPFLAVPFAFVCFIAPVSGDEADDAFKRGKARRNRGEHDAAIKECTEAIRLKPEYAEAYRNRGLVWHRKGELDKAFADYQAIRLKRAYACVYNSRAWLQSTCPDEKYRDAKEAIVNAKQAVELTSGENWEYIASPPPRPRAAISTRLLNRR